MDDDSSPSANSEHAAWEYATRSGEWAPPPATPNMPAVFEPSEPSVELPPRSRKCEPGCLCGKHKRRRKEAARKATLISRELARLVRDNTWFKMLGAARLTGSDVVDPGHDFDPGVAELFEEPTLTVGEVFDEGFAIQGDDDERGVDPDRGQHRPREEASDENAALIDLLETRSGQPIKKIREAFALEVGPPLKWARKIRDNVRPVLVELDRPGVAPLDLAQVLGCATQTIKREVAKARRG